MMHADIQAAEAIFGPPLIIAPCSSPVVYVEPLDRDLPDDPAVRLTHRQLIRLVLIAAETGARFEREGIAMDPAAWLFAPRRLFDGRAAVDACAAHGAFIRAMLLHGLGLGLDAAPEAMDALLAEDGGFDCGEAAVIALPTPAMPAEHRTA
jgi:hypothetical protein